MAIKVRQSSLGGQERSVISACQSISETIPNLQKAIASLEGQANLKGQAVESARQFSSGVVAPLLITVQQFTDYFQENITKFLSEYDLEKDYTDTELEEKIEQLKATISTLESSIESLRSKRTGLKSSAKKALNKNISHKENILSAKHKQLEEYEKKLEKLKEYNNKSKTFLSELSSSMSNINTGIKQVSGGYNVATGRFVLPSQSDLEWTKGAKKYVQNKMPDINDVLSHLSEEEKLELSKKIEGKSEEEQVNTIQQFLIDKDIWKEYDVVTNFGLGIPYSIVSAVIEENLPKISKILNDTSYKLPVGSIESGTFYMASKGTTFLSKGAPFIGTVLDYGQMVREGESEEDATNKAIAHTLMGVGSAALAEVIILGAPIELSAAAIAVSTIVISSIAATLFESIYDFIYDEIKKLDWKK